MSCESCYQTLCQCREIIAEQEAIGGQVAGVEIQIAGNAASAERFRDRRGCARSAERIEHQVAAVRIGANDAFEVAFRELIRPACDPSVDRVQRGAVRVGKGKS